MTTPFLLWQTKFGVQLTLHENFMSVQRIRMVIPLSYDEHISMTVVLPN